MRDPRRCAACAPARRLTLRPATLRSGRPSLRRMAAFALVIAGAAVGAAGLCHPAKARLGQHLLGAAWEKTRAGDAAKPWSWADFTPVALIAAPRLGVSQVALSDASGAAMAWGPGHVVGTAAPGGAGLSAFAGHRDSHFAFLGDLKPGDAVEVETTDGLRRYRVTNALVVDGRRWRFPRGGPQRLALSTCWPLGSGRPGPLRLVVFADQVGEVL